LGRWKKLDRIRLDQVEGSHSYSETPVAKEMFLVRFPFPGLVAITNAALPCQCLSDNWFLQKVSDFLLSSHFVHYSLVQVGYSAFAVNQCR
jgi:hypothetical protein